MTRTLLGGYKGRYRRKRSPRSVFPDFATTPKEAFRFLCSSFYRPGGIDLAILLPGRMQNNGPRVATRARQKRMHNCSCHLDIAGISTKAHTHFLSATPQCLGNAEANRRVVLLLMHSKLPSKWWIEGKLSQKIKFASWI